MVHEAANAVKVPVIGMGGIENEYDVIDFLSVGASAVMVGSINLVEPFACKNIIERLPAALEAIGAKSVKEIIGRTDR